MSEETNKNNETVVNESKPSNDVYVEQTKNVDLNKKELYTARITQTKLHLLELQEEIKNPIENPVVKSIIENEINITEAYYHVLEMKLMIIKE